MSTTINYPTKISLPSRFLLHPRQYFEDDLLSIYRVMVKECKIGSVKEQKHLLKAGANLFIDMGNNNRYKFKGQTSGTDALEICNDVAGKKPMYVYEVYKVDTTINLGKETDLVRKVN